MAVRDDFLMLYQTAVLSNKSLGTAKSMWLMERAICIPEAKIIAEVAKNRPVGDLARDAYDCYRATLLNDPHNIPEWLEGT